MSNEQNQNGELPQIPEILPLLPIRDVVIFPFMRTPLLVGRHGSIKAVDEALVKDRLLFCTTQVDINDENPVPNGLYKTGCVASILRMYKTPDGKVNLTILGIMRAKVVNFIEEEGITRVQIQMVKEQQSADMTLELEALIRHIRDLLEKIATLGKVIAPEILIHFDEIQDPGKLADIICSQFSLKVKEAQEIFEENNPIKRLKKVGELLNKELEVLTMQAKIQHQAKEEISKTQKEYFLKEQLRAIRNELGDSDNKAEEMDELKEKIEKIGMPEEAKKEALKQLKRLETMFADSAEASIIRTYLDWLINLPWSITTKDNINIKKAKNILDEDHYNLEKVKDRILDYMGVCKIKKKIKGPILCFIGPPGVGKTSLGKSIARAMGRKFVRMSLGGMKDEAEIRGHRRTYVGALPGRLIQGIKTAGSNNPVFMLDEIDKIGSDFRGDPSSALLEVLDPEQNFSFQDHYLNIPFDLSKVMFIATGNLTDTIPSALKDRMEMMYLAGYTEEEKIRICEQFLIPKQVEENGLKKDSLKFEKESLIHVIRHYTREAGLRNLERNIATICRKVARVMAEDQKPPKTITPELVTKFLGPEKFMSDTLREKDEIGISTGLAWTQYGGEILLIETSIMPGHRQLTLTGQLGSVMKESAMAALTYIKTKSNILKIKSGLFDKLDIHVHVPEGAVPKDGPSAGITIATSIISALANKPVRRDIAMTGEITLTGRVLPVGGVKEKVLAAMRMNIKTIIIPEQNKKDLSEITPEILKKVKFVTVKHMDDVIRQVFKVGK